MSNINRPPAIKRAHPADALPEKPSPTPEPTTMPPSAAAISYPAPPPAELAERLIEQHNVRIRPSTKARLSRAVDKLRYETGDRTISAASLTDRAITEYLDRHGC
ncbi:hypothetical protein [Nocardia neocaledoniensis]|uniref:hypothetical protein n=1 Tax=Nocardia neocaledoniensis TaxID=236511 RepID=UPI0024550E7B|nr:hypothetical protein [Nocardia neocaledoniensis]